MFGSPTMVGTWWRTAESAGSAALGVPSVGYICSRARRRLAVVDVITSMSRPVLALRSSTTAVRVGSSIATTRVCPTRAIGTTSRLRAKRGLMRARKADRAERLLPAALLGEGHLELGGRDRLRLDQELAELRAPPVAVEDRQELAARDHLLGDEDVAEEHVRLRLALQSERLLDLRVGRETFGDEEVAEPQDRRVTARRAVGDRESTAVDRDQPRRFDFRTRTRSHSVREQSNRNAMKGREPNN